MARLKVFAGWTIHQGVTSRNRPQCKVLVAAPSRAEVARLLDCGIRHVTNYMGETGNAHDIETAMAQPGVVFLAPMDALGPAQWKPEGEWT